MPDAFWFRPWVRVAGAAVLALLVAGAVLVWRGPLPAPRPLGRDPVPAERDFTATPPDCGVTRPAVAALVPGGTLTRDGGVPEADGVTCEWSALEATGRLTVTLTLRHAGPGVANATGPGDSSAAAAMSRYAALAVETRAQARPVAGLGDEAFASRDGGQGREVVFRTGNLIASAEYVATEITGRKGRRALEARLQAGASRAAADVARSLGVPAHPHAAAVRPAPAPVALPDSACGLIPADLRKRLAGGDAETGPETADPLAAGGAVANAATAACFVRGPGRRLTVTLTTGTRTPGLPVPDVDYEYLRRYRDARAEPPVSAHGARYFHALSGLGDRAYEAYVEGSQYPGETVVSPARVVVRTHGGVLVTVTYGTVPDTGSDPLTEDDAINGAYAVALRVVRGVRG